MKDRVSGTLQIPRALCRRPVDIGKRRGQKADSQVQKGLIHQRLSVAFFSLRSNGSFRFAFRNVLCDIEGSRLDVLPGLGVDQPLLWPDEDGRLRRGPGLLGPGWNRSRRFLEDRVLGETWLGMLGEIC